MRLNRIAAGAMALAGAAWMLAPVASSAAAGSHIPAVALSLSLLSPLRVFKGVMTR